MNNKYIKLRKYFSETESTWQGKKYTVRKYGHVCKTLGLSWLSSVLVKFLLFKVYGIFLYTR